MAATSATDIVSLDLMRSELRIPSGDADIDTLITAQIQAAVSYISARTDRPLLVESKTYRAGCFPSDDNEPLQIPVRYVTSVTRIDYWTAAGAIRDPADGNFVTADLGRLEIRDDGLAYVYAPSTGWPTVLENSPVVVTYGACWDYPDAIKQAAILLTRDAFEGQRMTQPSSAVARLLEPYLPYGSEVPEPVTERRSYYPLHY